MHAPASPLGQWAWAYGPGTPSASLGNGPKGWASGPQAPTAPLGFGVWLGQGALKGLAWARGPCWPPWETGGRLGDGARLGHGALWAPRAKGPFGPLGPATRAARARTAPSAPLGLSPQLCFDLLFCFPLSIFIFRTKGTGGSRKMMLTLSCFVIWGCLFLICSLFLPVAVLLHDAYDVLLHV